jgi:phage terminase large subunit-like protein
LERVLIGKLDVAGRGEHSIRGWDIAATKQFGTRDPDWTVGLRLTNTRAGSHDVDDVVRLHGGPDEVDDAILKTAQRELLAYLERNRGALVHYAARRRNGEPISTALVESAVNKIVAKRMNKKQQTGTGRRCSPCSTCEPRC